MIRRLPPILLRDRLVGGLVGLVAGDALGVPVEFEERARRDRDPVRGMRGWGAHHQPAGTWSDDGALALAHADAFLAHGWDPARHLDAFAAWLDGGAYSAHGRVFDVGMTTKRAIQRHRRGLPVHAVGGRDAASNGNGSLMRMLPVACWWIGAPAEQLADAAEEASALTHAHPRARLCCAWYAIVAAAVFGRRSVAGGLEDAARILAPRLPPPERPLFASLIDGSCLSLDRAAVPSDGHVLSTLIAACWCLHRHADAAGAMLEAVNLGGDTDSTAAVTGGLAGLRHGLTGIPRPWIACLPRAGWVVAQAERFADACLARAR